MVGGFGSAGGCGIGVLIGALGRYKRRVEVSRATLMTDGRTKIALRNHYSQRVEA